MKKKIYYVTRDGAEFTAEEAALRHEATMDLQQRIENTSDELENVAEDVASWIFKHQTEVAEYLRLLGDLK